MTKRHTRVHQPVTCWFALADGEQCRLLGGSARPRGDLVVEEYAVLRNRVPPRDRGRPLALGAMTGHSYAAPGHEMEEDRRRFAGEIADWLEQKARRHSIERLTILASPKVLGILRQQSFGSLHGKIQLRDGDLIQLREGQLAQHGLVRSLFSAEE